MSDVLKNEDKLGSVLIQVQDDLKQLKSSLEKISANEMGQTLDIKALDNAIRKTESTIKEHADNYLKTVNKQQLVLPNIEDLQKKRMQVPKWKPSLESITDVHSQREDLPGVSRGEKQKLALNMYLLHNLARPKNRASMHRKCGISLPVVHKRSTDAAKRHRLITGFVVSDQAREPKGCHIPAVPEEDMGTVPHPSSLHMSIQHKAASLHPREDLFSKIGSKSRCHKQPKWKTKPTFISVGIDKESTSHWTTKAPPPTATSKSLDQKNMERDTDSLIPKSPENLPVHVPLNMTKYPFIIIKGQIDPLATDFCHFKRRFSLCWSSVVDPLEALTKLLRDFAVPVAKVSGEQLVELSHGWESGWKKTPTETTVLPVLENWEEVLDLVLHPGQRYKGEGGIEAAAIRIQSCWRRYSAEITYLCHCRRKWAAGTIAISWLMHTQMRRVRKALQARRFSQLEKNRSRAQHLAANWKHIQSSKRTIIHIPSLGYSQSQRRNLKGFDILQNIQISRVCDVRDGNVEVIYICPQHLEDDILLYYTNLLKCDRAADGADTSSCSRRFIILTPEAVGSFPTHNMCLSTLLKYSPRTLKRIRNLIQGKQAYIVGGVAHTDDLAVADELGVPILGSEPAVAQLYRTKSGGRRIFAGAEVDVPPGQGDIYSLNQLHETLAELMAQYIDVKRWLFKMDSEHGGRGTAYCDVNHLSCYNWALQEYHRYGAVVWNTKWIQEPVMLRYLDEIPEWLAHHARPAKISCYPNWACFLKTFLRQGGVVEACPPSDSVTCLTVALLLEPSGEVTMLSCGDQLHGSCQLGVLGATVPQTSVHPETLHSICIRVGQACLQRLIVGHVSIDLATFLDHNTMDQKVWAVDLDIAYSDQLAMTQMLLMLTGGTLNCRAGCLEVPMPVREKCCEHQIEAKLIKKGPTVYHMCPVLIMFTNQTHKLNSDPEDMHEPPVGNRYAVIGIHLFHSNLSMLYRSVFFKICKAHGIVFNKEMKQGTVFALYESSEQCSIGMITVSEDLQGALVTFARSLSVIHQEISSPKMPAETNFKGLIKEIEDVLQIIVKNKIQLQDKPAV